jgi:hypothetical protein
VDGVLLWDNVWPPTPGVSPVHRAALLPLKDRVSRAASGEIDRIAVVNRASVPMLLYSIGIPRPLAGFRATAYANLFASTQGEAFPATVELHRVEPRTLEERAAYAQWAMGLSPDRAHVELPLDAAAPTVGDGVLTGWRWLEKRANALRIALPEGHGGGWLVLSEPFARGWSCRVDGAAAGIYPVDTLFRAVAVPAGAREVTMRFFPPGLWRGMLVAALTAALMGILRVRSSKFEVRSFEKKQGRRARG